MRRRGENHDRPSLGDVATKEEPPGVFCLGLLTTLGGASEVSVTAGLVLDPPPFVRRAAALPAEVAEAPLRAQGYQDGIGLGWPASRRFGGRGHSDGVLDWDCLEFGLIEKLYLAAHPQNASHRRWAVRFCPLQMNEISFLWPQLDEASRRTLKSNARSVLLDSPDGQARFKETELFQSIDLLSAEFNRSANEAIFEFGGNGAWTVVVGGALRSRCNGTTGPCPREPLAGNGSVGAPWCAAAVWAACACSTRDAPRRARHGGPTQFQTMTTTSLSPRAPSRAAAHACIHLRGAWCPGQFPL